MNSKEQLKVLAEKCFSCTACPLSEHRTKVVYGDGSVNTQIMVIGEAPGRNEDEQGIPFVGAAGKNLNKYLEIIGLSREDVYITNTVKCRPPENRDPKPNEINICAEKWLIEQIQVINPKIICTLGNYATKYVLGSFRTDKMKTVLGISKLHGDKHSIQLGTKMFTVIPLYHPAAIMYNRGLEVQMQEDLKKIKEIINAVI